MTKRRANDLKSLITENDCIETSRLVRVTVEEAGVAATFLNPKKRLVRKIRFDDCYNKVKVVKQADFIVSLVGIVDVLVELKGSDLKRAVQQIEATLASWKSDPNSSGRIAGLIVYGKVRGPGRVPRMTSSVQSLLNTFQVTHKIYLQIQETGARRYKFSDFLPQGVSGAGAK